MQESEEVEQIVSADQADRDLVRQLIEAVLSRMELNLTSGFFGTDEEIRRATEKLRRQYGSRQYFITCGEAGAYAVDDAGEVLFALAPKPEPLVDTVGAGDAFAAATIIGVSRDRPLDDILEFAVRFASCTCELQGATVNDPGHYARFQR